MTALRLLVIAAAFVCTPVFPSHAITLILTDFVEVVRLFSVASNEFTGPANRLSESGASEILSSPTYSFTTASLLDSDADSFVESIVISLFEPSPQMRDHSAIPAGSGTIGGAITIPPFTDSHGAMGLLGWQFKRRVAAAV